MIAWHYTTGQKFSAIVESGFLKPTELYVTPPEKPILWFSTNQHWENTANKAWQYSDGTSTILTMEEMFERGQGLVRFGISLNYLYSGQELRRKAKMNKQVWRALCQEGLRRKAKPDEWHGYLKPIPVEKLIVEVINKNFEWEKVRESE